MMVLLEANSRWLYLLLVVLVVLARLFELRVSDRNTRRALGRGGVEVGASHYPVMVALHAAFLVACPLEVWALERPFRLPLAAAMLVLLLAATALRRWVIATLGERWTTRVIYRPGTPPVTAGPYRFLRHPNYLAVAIEIAALPLVHGAWLTATGFTIANGLLLRERIRVENDALERFGGPAPTVGGAR